MSRSLVTHPRQKISIDPMTPFRFIDLFAGIGGMRKGFEPFGGECVFTSEWNNFARKTYEANFTDDRPIAGDIRGVDAWDIPAHDLLLAGFPCQPFSIAGVSKKNSLGREHGFACETQGTLFFEIARILDYHKPQAFLLENVKNLASHDKGRTFKTILAVLEEELRYKVRVRVIDARSFVPQHRERVFIAGFKEQNDFSFNQVRIPNPALWPRLGTVLHPEDGSAIPEEPYTDSTGHAAAKYVLSEHLWQYLQDYAIKHKAKGNGFGFGLFGRQDIARTLSARYFKDGAEILIKRESGPPRRLTPRECSRLMGFDRPGEANFRIPVSDTQAYKQFGNAVVVPVVAAIAEAMTPYVQSNTESDMLTPPAVLEEARIA
jgi:DNA (cytosine-5)-methyltransferase 1